MAFTKKNLQQQSVPVRRLTVFKYLTVFFLGASCVLLMTQAFDINTTLSNAVQYIQQIILTNDGSNSPSATTGIILDGTANGGITITNLTSAVVLGTDPNGKITGSNASNVYNLISGNFTSGNIYNSISGYFTSGNTYNSISGYLYWTGIGSNIANTNIGGNVGIGTNTPNEKLEVAGNIRVNGGFNPAVVVGTDNQGSLKASTSGDVYNLISGLIVSAAGYRTPYGNDIYNSNYTGNVGIGTTPSEKLEVDGNIKARGNISLADSITFLADGTDKSISPMNSRDASGYNLTVSAGNFDNQGGSPGPYNGGDLKLNAGDGETNLHYPLSKGGDVYINGGIGLDTGNIFLGDRIGNVSIGFHPHPPVYTLEVNGTGLFANDVIISNLTNAPVLGTDHNGTIIASTSQDVYDLISGLIPSTGPWTGNGTNIWNTALTENVGIGTDAPTEKLQVGTYAWIGQHHTVTTTGGSFLRLYGELPAALPQHIPKYSPNIQLNYQRDSSLGGPSQDNWQIDNMGPYLNFNYATGADIYETQMNITNAGRVGINLGGYNPNQTLELSGNVRLTNGGYIQAGNTPNQLYLDKTNGYVGINTPNTYEQLTVEGNVRIGDAGGNSDYSVVIPYNAAAGKVLTADGPNGKGEWQPLPSPPSRQTLITSQTFYQTWTNENCSNRCDDRYEFALSIDWDACYLAGEMNHGDNAQGCSVGNDGSHWYIAAWQDNKSSSVYCEARCIKLN